MLMSSREGTWAPGHPRALSPKAALPFLQRPHPACPGARFSAGSLHFPGSATLQSPVRGCCGQKETTHTEPQGPGWHPTVSLLGTCFLIGKMG